MVFFPVGIRKSALSSARPSLADAAYCGDPSECQDYGDDGNIDGNLGTLGQAGPALSDGFGWWAGEGFSVGGFASIELSAWENIVMCGFGKN